MRDRHWGITLALVVGVSAILLAGTAVRASRLERRNEELSGAIKQYIRAAALYAQRNQMLEGQLSWCLNTTLADAPSIEQVSQ